MKNTDLRKQIAAAIIAKDKNTLKQLKEQLGASIWLSQFNGSVPITAWLEPNPLIAWKETKQDLNTD